MKPLIEVFINESYSAKYKVGDKFEALKRFSSTYEIRDVTKLKNEDYYIIERYKLGHGKSKTSIECYKFDKMVKNGKIKKVESFK